MARPHCSKGAASRPPSGNARKRTRPPRPPPRGGANDPASWATRGRITPRPAPAAAPPPAGRVALRRWLGGLRLAYAPILTTYFCYGASGITGVALLYFQKDALALTPAG